MKRDFRKRNSLKKWIMLAGMGTGILLTGCGSKKPMTAENFTKKMEDMGYSVTDCKSDYSEYDYIQNVFVAVDPDQKYQIEFYDLDTPENAQGFYENNKSIMKNGKDSGSTEKEVQSGNHEKYTSTQSQEYDLLSRIDDTVVYVVTTKENKKAVEGVVKELGY